MKRFEITEEQRNSILNVLGEIPSKFSLQPILMLNQLKEIKDPIEEKKTNEPVE